MNTSTQYRGVEACRKALEGCPHDHGTVKSICRVCLGQLTVHAWDTDDPMFVEIDCPLCIGEGDLGGVEVCPCVEDFSPDTIAKAIEELRAESAEHQQKGAEADAPREQEEDLDDEFGPLYVDHYNDVRLNSAVGYITPKDVLAGRQQEIHAERDRKLEEARKQRQVRCRQVA